MVSATSEFTLIDRYFTRATPGAVLGPGDDCALIAPSPGCELAMTTDMLVEGTHFFANAEPGSLGWKSLAVNLSDLAAMGATPRWVLLAGSFPTPDEAWLASFAKGLFELADEYGVNLVGGDTTRGPRNLCLTAIGEIPRGQALRRDGGKPGDDVWVSGRPGLAALGLAELQGKTTLPEAVSSVSLSALNRPQPRLALGIALRGIASAAIDVSDGLLGDLTHILERSACGAEIELSALPALPVGVDVELARQAQLSGGDDYELVFCAPPEHRLRIGEISSQLGLSLTRFGRLIAGDTPRIAVRDTSGNMISINRLGYDHFV